MNRALKLARRGIGSVEPNPAVGAVLVKANQIIGKGWHKEFGGPHAEINALADCRKLAFNPQGATMYVTLEPCCHQGKTAPCTDAIIAAGLAKVVVAMIDPSEHANGKGIEQLGNAGIEIRTGVCETQAKLLNAPFIKFATTGKCWVILKWAQSIDGKLSYPEGNDSSRHRLCRSRGKRWISGEQSRKDVHKLRRRVQGILVGINTVIADDPLLTARPSRDKKATRIVLDSRLQIPLDCRLLATAKNAPVLIVANNKVIQTKAKKAEQIRQTGVELLGFPQRVKSNLQFLLGQLSKRGIQHLLVEGGPTVIGSFMKENLADEIVVYIVPKILGMVGNADIAGKLDEYIRLCCVDIKRIGSDVRINGLTENGLKAAGISRGKL